MAGAKELKKKIKSISNTRKITRTMEMVATSKAKKTQSRVAASTPYARKLAELVGNLVRPGGENGSRDHFLLQAPEEVTHSAALVVTANRGLCGAYNTNVCNMGEKWAAAAAEAGCRTDLTVIGKKGIARFKYRRVAVARGLTHIADRPSFQDADEIAKGYIERFRKGEVGRVVVISTRYLSAGVQKPAVVQLLPIPAVESQGAASAAKEFLFEPGPQEILEALLPFSVSYLLYRLLLEAAASEQVARRVAMKLATDNAEELIKLYTRRYNRQRQAKITQQIAEIVTAADAQG